MSFRLTINGRVHDVEVPPGTTLLAVLRDDLELTGTRYGCGHGACGACMVLADGVPLPSCMMTVEGASSQSIVTIEGLASDDGLHPVQRAFLDEDAMQCGYCTSGLIISAVALLDRAPRPTDAQIRDALARHLCRCGVYGRIVRAVKRAAR